MILLLGASGYVGEAFAQALRERKLEFTPLARAQADYTRFNVLREYLEKTRPKFVINAAGYTGKPNVDACEIHRADTLQGNTLLPVTIAHACQSLDIPYGHVSSGCIFTGAKFMIDGKERVKPDLLRPELQQMLEKNPTDVHGFDEDDEPNFTFRRPPCSFYSGTKALAEESLLKMGRGYIWRLRIPFDSFDNPRNYLSKVQNYPKVYQNYNSLSHRGDFVNACIALCEKRAPFGVYNVTNPGYVSTRQVVSLIKEILRPPREFEFWVNDAEFYKVAAKTPRSNCILDASRLTAEGVTMRPVIDALTDSLKRWTPAPK